MPAPGRKELHEPQIVALHHEALEVALRQLHNFVLAVATAARATATAAATAATTAARAATQAGLSNRLGGVESLVDDGISCAST